MVKIFSSKNPKSYHTVRTLLSENGINQYTKEDYITSLEYTSYKIYIREEDYEKSREVLNTVQEERIYYYEDYDLASMAVVFMLLVCILTGLWFGSY